ncbi:carboxymuconolactone decarboxylase family protein [Agromyces indicus]|uniref:Carboxymuconolactone decarboxylase family protein n=1 Tax=Agromyces indicus TaxID=758919 RepID=A0ABU1FFV2_9MICO|nr:carboxymuconolactone decarboxylase family protein [Agromyces indicus]MDR5690644.1 carboxymuconolactone decarboxylase family protein [Agromyces indicus]
MEPIERLRRLALDAERGGDDLDPQRTVDRRTLALARIAALVAVGGAQPSFGSEVDAAIGEGATDQEMVEVLTAVIPVVGMARAVAAAPRLALALGYDDLLESS